MSVERTFIYKLIKNDNTETVKVAQNRKSIDIRKLYNNQDKWDDETFLSTLFTKKAKDLEHLKMEVKSLIDKNETFKKKQQKELYDILTKIHRIKTSKKGVSDLSLKNKESFYYKNLLKRKERLEKILKQKLVFGGRTNLQKRTKGLISHKEFHDGRRYMIVNYGEMDSKGNRCYDLSQLSKGIIIYNSEHKKGKLLLQIDMKRASKQYIEMLSTIETLTNNKELNVTVKLSHEEIHFTIDYAVVKGYFHKKKVEKQFREQYKTEHNTKIKPGELYKLTKQAEEENKKELLSDKLNRYCAVDLNPSCIGVVICDAQHNILLQRSYEIEGELSSNKRKFEICNIVKGIFKECEHYKCSYFVYEKLDNVQTAKDNSKSNKKIINEWHKNLTIDLIEKNCTIYKIVPMEIDASYSSFLGNLYNDLYDPIAAAKELCSRVIDGKTNIKWGNSFIPASVLDSVRFVMYKSKKLEAKIGSDGLVNVKKLFDIIRAFDKSKATSYRRKEKSFFSVFLSEKSSVKVYTS